MSRDIHQRDWGHWEILAEKSPHVKVKGGTLSSFSQSSTRGASRRRRRAESRASQADQPGHSRGRRAERRRLYVRVVRGVGTGSRRIRREGIFVVVVVVARVAPGGRASLARGGGDGPFVPPRAPVPAK